MALNRISICCLFFILCFSVLWLPDVQAQMAGSPVGSKGQGEWTVSAIGNYLHQDLEEETALSKRLLLKSAWGISPFLDMYILGGWVQLDMRTSINNVDDYHGTNEFGYGAGIKLSLQRVSHINTFGVWLGVQALRFPSGGSYIEYLTEAEDADVYREFQFNYDWRELQVNFGFTIPYQSFRLYVAGTGWLLSRIDTKREYLYYDEEKSFSGQAKDKYQTGLKKGVTLGGELQLAQQYNISLEFLLFDSKNYQVMVGICQTGVLGW